MNLRQDMIPLLRETWGEQIVSGFGFGLPSLLLAIPGILLGLVGYKLHPLGFLVPEPLAICDDPSVIGAIFYVMEMAKGRPYADGALPIRIVSMSNSHTQSPTTAPT